MREDGRKKQGIRVSDLDGERDWSRNRSRMRGPERLEVIRMGSKGLTCFGMCLGMERDITLFPSETGGKPGISISASLCCQLTEVKGSIHLLAP